MNSHAPPINIQSTQSVVVGHHRGFSQPSSNVGSADPWFLQTSHQMAPTAPARQHKRPAPQPGLMVQSTQQSNQQQQHHSTSIHDSNALQQQLHHPINIVSLTEIIKFRQQ